MIVTQKYDKLKLFFKTLLFRYYYVSYETLNVSNIDKIIQSNCFDLYKHII